ncbi:MAG: EamA family transporter [Actinomycetales bacterium]|nr:EamA family transporter [Actinomycetales bacterium]
MGTDRNRTAGIAMYLVAAALFALFGTMSKAAFAVGMDPLHWTQLRNIGAAVLMLAIVAAWAPRGFRIHWRDLGFLLAYGAVAFMLVQYLYFLTVSRLPVGIGTLLVFLAPIGVVVWLRFIRRRPVGPLVWLALGLAVGGLALVAEAWQGIRLDGVGVAAGLACAIALALYWLMGERGAQQRDALSLTMWGFVFASLGWAVVAPWSGFPWAVLTRDATPINEAWPVPVWSIMAWGVVLGTVVPFLLVVGSLRRIGSQRAGIVGTTEPLWAVGFGLLLLGESLSVVQGLGALIVVAGIVTAEIAGSRAGTPAAAIPSEAPAGPGAVGSVR